MAGRIKLISLCHFPSFQKDSMVWTENDLVPRSPFLERPHLRLGFDTSSAAEIR
jgi:hypothetical protein